MNAPKPIRTWLPLAAAALLSACGTYEAPPDVVAGPPTDDPAATGSCAELLATRVQPRLEFCRNCHVKDGIADVADGNNFLLTANRADDEKRLKAAWNVLGTNAAGVSRLLAMAAGTDEKPHSGGAPWPEDSQAYEDMASLLAGFADPKACVLGAAPAAERPLLAGPRGGNAWANFCEGKEDDAVLPLDPRELVVEGVNQGKAVAFNAYWRSCDNGGTRPGVARPKTCGQMRTQAQLGWLVGEGQGEIGTPMAFAGGNDDPGGLPAEQYNNLWQTAWELSERPDNFDELVMQRYGSPESTHRNPYPLPGEDPNAPGMNGGSGQLPLIFTQLRDAETGAWTGEIGTKVCVLCHNGQLGTVADGPGMGPQVGGAGSIGDFTVQGYDFAKAAGMFSAPSPTNAITISTNRGTGAIDFFQLAFILFSNGDPELLLNDKIVFSQAIGNIKSPPWWNLAYRPQKFHGAVLPTDSSRIDLAAYYNLSKGMQDGLASNFGREPAEGESAIDWVDQHAGPFQTWAESLPSPVWPWGYCSNADGTPAPGDPPHCIDKPLAERGAILFHSKNLWAGNLGNTVPKPDAGNGSCASCHGAYSPRYAHDTRYLDRPELAGIAAYTVPMAVIGTDPVYADAMQSLRNDDGTTNESILKQDVVYCGLGNAGHTEDNTPILLAPPLWGAWASAPYLHNGSLPNIWAVLDPASERPDIWRRVSTPARLDQLGKVVMGYDTDFGRAYDFDKLGWKYDELPCSLEDSTTQPVTACNPAEPNSPSPVQALLGQIYTQVGALWNLPRPEGLTMTQRDVENRKIFNTNLYSQGNGGHAFTSVLTDAERRALVEYLKTL